MAQPRIQTKADKAVKSIIEDLRNRRGLQQEWDQIDLDVRKEIAAKWAGHILEHLNAKDEPAPEENTNLLTKID